MQPEKSWGGNSRKNIYNFIELEMFIVIDIVQPWNFLNKLTFVLLNLSLFQILIHKFEISDWASLFKCYCSLNKL
jgi:hypothetical protein